MTQSFEIAIVGSGFAGLLLARVLAVIGYDVVLLERGSHPRFAIGESSTPLANLSLERLGTRYGLADCYHLATQGRWLTHHPELRRGLKRGFTFYRHHQREAFADCGLDSERLLVAASPDDALSDTHWFRADVDEHFVRQAVAAGVAYLDETELTSIELQHDGARLEGTRRGEAVALNVGFVIDASGPGGFLARQLSIPSDLKRTQTRSALLFSHFDGVRLVSDVVPGLSAGSYPDDWAAVHHLIDEGWMYSLRFDHGTTSAGFLLTPEGVASLGLEKGVDPTSLWHTLLARYPTIAALFANATPLMPIAYRPMIQHRLAKPAGERWLMMPHAYALVDPLFSTGIAWSLRAVERLALMFENAKQHGIAVSAAEVARYASLLSREADQIDLVVAGAYAAMAHFDLFAAQAMLYFASVSFAEVSQRLASDASVAWSGFLGVNDPVLEPLPRESLTRLRAIDPGSAHDRRSFTNWIGQSIGPRNIAGLADPARHNLYPVDFDALIEAHSLLGRTRDQLVAALPALRGRSPEPAFLARGGGRSTLQSAQRLPAPETPARR
jgi:FADH2 O2-dependent halogenase